jgi:hypothetical protein
MIIEKAVKKIIRKLNRKGIPCKLVHLSDYGSCYIHFEGSTNGIRVADHREKDGLKYLYNIRADIFVKQINDGRYFFPISQTSKAINFIIRKEKKRRRQEDYDNRNRSR